MTDVKTSGEVLESSVSLAFMVVAAFASALVWLWAMLGQLTAP
jgi:hypothetical protein